ncbi:MAG: ABC transporter permease [Mycoplasmataceae bacterium]|nr:ABC transporter permease [Mycoplasmataceae bacterium]
MRKHTNTRHYHFKKIYFNFDLKKIWLIIPFLILALLLIVIPLIFILIRSFIPAPDLSVSENWNIIDGYIFEKIFISIFVALMTTIFCVLLAYPFTYILSQTKNMLYRSIVILIATAPIWTSFLVKLVGVKTFFDVMYGYKNATYGNFFVIIGLIYLYVPFMITPLYSTLAKMPKNLIWASYDLGYNSFQTFFRVVVPYTFTALMSGVALVFLPSLTTVAVPQFLNNASDGTLIGDLIVNEGNIAGTSEIALARVSALSSTLLFTIAIGYVLIILAKKGYRWYRIKGRDKEC